MLSVKTPDEVFFLIRENFAACMGSETVPLSAARGRVLAWDITGGEFIPGFDRSTVDGYALAAADTFGCSESMPALLDLRGQVAMGEGGGSPLSPGECCFVPTGAALPTGADAVVMLEHVEDYGDGSVGVMKPAAPGENLINRGDDVHPGKCVLPAGSPLCARDIGALAALGITEVKVCRKPLVGILSTGDELVGVDQVPGEGQVRDVNSAMLAALVEDAGGEARCYGIFRDEEALLRAGVKTALAECDMVLVSGGSSVGAKDATCRVIGEMGEVLLHGIAMKPGKPTILGKADGKPVFGLPGHPLAAFFVSRLFVRFTLARLMGRNVKDYTLTAMLTESVSANHGREQLTAVRLTNRGGRWYAHPIRSKSGLVTSLASSDGYFAIPRDREGYAAGEAIDVYLYSID